MHLPRTVILLVVLTLGLAACGGDDDATLDVGVHPTTDETGDPDTEDSDGADDPAADGAEALAGRSFLGDQVTEDGEPRDLVGEMPLRLTFEDDGTVGGSGGCNSLGGVLDIDALSEGRLVVPADMDMTLMACEPAALMDQDTWFAGLLTAGMQWRLDGDDLVLVAGTTEIRLTDRRVVEPDQALVGTRWVVDTIFDAQMASSIPTTAEPVLVLADDGTAVFNTGCNDGTATWELSGDTLRFPEIFTNLAGCLDERGDVEIAVKAVLGRPLVVEISADRLTLTTPDGDGLGLRADASG